MTTLSKERGEGDKEGDEEMEGERELRSWVEMGILSKT